MSFSIFYLRIACAMQTFHVIWRCGSTPRVKAVSDGRKAARRYYFDVLLKFQETIIIIK